MTIKSKEGYTKRKGGQRSRIFLWSRPGQSIKIRKNREAPNLLDYDGRRVDARNDHCCKRFEPAGTSGETGAREARGRTHGRGRGGVLDRRGSDDRARVHSVPSVREHHQDTAHVARMDR